MFAMYESLERRAFPEPAGEHFEMFASALVAGAVSAREHFEMFASATLCDMGRGWPCGPDTAV